MGADHRWHDAEPLGDRARRELRNAGHDRRDREDRGDEGDRCGERLAQEVGDERAGAEGRGEGVEREDGAQDGEASERKACR